MLEGVSAVWKREMKKWYRNRTQLISSMLLPVLFLIIVGNAYSGTFSHVNIVVINNDVNPNDLPAQLFVDYLENSSTFIVQNNVSANSITYDDARTMIDSGQIDGIIVIPANFSLGIMNPTLIGPNTQTQVNVTADNTNFMVAQALEASCAEILNTTLHDPQMKTWYENNPLNPLHKPYFVPRPSINDINQYGGADYKFIDFLAPGILAMTVLFTSLFAAGMPIMLDREIGYFDMLLTTPVRRSELVAGFTLAGVTKVVAQATFTLVIALLLGIHMSLNPLSILYLYIFVVLLALGFVGISIALATKIELTAFQFVNGLINFPVFFLSGAFYPVESLPDWLRVVVQLNPMTYAVSAMRSIMIKGTSIGNVLPDLGVVAIFAILTQLLGNAMLLMVLSGKSKGDRRRRKKVPGKADAVVLGAPAQVANQAPAEPASDANNEGPPG